MLYLFWIFFDISAKMNYYLHTVDSCDWILVFVSSIGFNAGIQTVNGMPFQLTLGNLYVRHCFETS